MKADKIIEKFGLRQVRVIGGKLGQKMEEDCIRMFVDGDPSGTFKYLEWMFYQAGGGGEVLHRTMTQWSEGEHGEPSLHDQIRYSFLSQRANGWTDDLGTPIQRVTAEAATAAWEVQEEEMKWYHVYGDEDYVMQGGFGFYRSWPGPDDRYAIIVDTVRRFHRHQQALRVKGRSTDLNLGNYPTLASLLVVLKDVTAAELKEDVDYDLVYSDEWVQVYCPYNIGASLKLGISKWCTANESMFMSALAGEGKNRWKEYAGESALYYCHFRNCHSGSKIRHVAIQIVLNSGSKAVSQAKYWDADDKANTLSEFLAALSLCPHIRMDHMTSFQAATNAVAEHFRQFNRGRLVTNFSP